MAVISIQSVRFSRRCRFGLYADCGRSQCLWLCYRYTFELRKLMRFAARSKVAPTTERSRCRKLTTPSSMCATVRRVPRGVESRFLKIIRSADLRRCLFRTYSVLSYRQHSLPTLFVTLAISWLISMRTISCSSACDAPVPQTDFLVTLPA